MHRRPRRARRLAHQGASIHHQQRADPVLRFQLSTQLFAVSPSIVIMFIDSSSLVSPSPANSSRTCFIPTRGMQRSVYVRDAAIFPSLTLPDFAPGRRLASIRIESARATISVTERLQARDPSGGASKVCGSAVGLLAREDGSAEQQRHAVTNGKRVVSDSTVGDGRWRASCCFAGTGPVPR